MEKKVLLTAVFFSLFCGSVCSSAQDLFFFHGAIHKNNSVDLIDFYLRDGFRDDFVETEEGKAHTDAYEMRLSTKDGETIFSGVTLISFVFFIDPVGGVPLNGSDVKEVGKRELFLKLPYSKAADYFRIFRKGEMIYSLDIAEKLCVKDGKCPDYCSNRNDPDCGTQTTQITATSVVSTTASQVQPSTSTTETVSSQPSPTSTAPERPREDQGYLAYFAAALVLVLVAFLIYKKAKSEKDIEKKRDEFEKWKKEQENKQA